MKNSFYFKDLLDHYLRCYDQLLASESDFPVNGSQKENDRNLLELKKLFLGWLDKGNHLADLESTGNKAVIKEKVLHFMINTLKIDSWACQILDQENYYEVSSQFITRAKEMLGESAFSEIFQALRNIWVMVALQIYMDVDVTLTDAMSAYSMLYPLTDNYLDNPSISTDDKSHFNHRFYQKILHNVDLSINDEEKRIFAMIDLIESDFNRKDFPDVYQSLLAILDGQNKSLSQHAGSSLSERDLLMFTFYKGGTSVLADAYLIKGSLSGKHALFAYGYGIILQLADDLQDIEEDIMNQHDTPYNTSAKKMLLDNQFLKHDSLIKHLMNEIYDKNNKKTIALHQLLDRSISLLLFSGVSQNQKLFSKTFMKKYLKSSMFSYRIFKKYNKKFMKKASL